MIALFWCTLVSASRLYLGMHSFAVSTAAAAPACRAIPHHKTISTYFIIKTINFQDIYVGLAFASFLLLIVAPLADLADFFLLSNPFAPLITITLSAAAVYWYPGSDRWTPARGDTTVILGCYLGTHLGAWCNFQLGILKGPPIPPPYPILWPTYAVYGQTLLRMALGAVVLIATRAIAKPIVHYATSFLIGADPEEMKRVKPDINNKPKLITEISTKFFVYLAVGFNCLFTVPVVFRAVGCERATFHTEV